MRKVDAGNSAGNMAGNDAGNAAGRGVLGEVGQVRKVAARVNVEAPRKVVKVEEKKRGRPRKEK